MYSASLLATACLVVAINGLTWIDKPWSSDIELLQALTQLTDINMKYIQNCMADVEDLIALNIAQLKQVISKNNGTSAISNKLNCSQAANGNQSQPETPTDVQDVLF